MEGTKDQREKGLQRLGQGDVLSRLSHSFRRYQTGPLKASGEDSRDVVESV